MGTAIDNLLGHHLTVVDESMSLQDAVIGLKAYKEVDQRMSRLCHDLNKAVLLPRMNINEETLPSIHIENVSAPSIPIRNAFSNP